MVLLHSLQEKSSIKTELEDSEHTSYLMVAKAKFVNRKLLYLVLFVLVLDFRAQVVNFNHATVAFNEEFPNVRALVSVHLLYPLSREPTSNHSVCYVGQVQVVALDCKATFVRRDQLSDPVSIEAQF